MRLGRLAIPITVVGVVLMLAGAGTAPAAARVQEPGVTAPSAAAMNLPAVATDAPETSAASGPAPESVVRVRVNPSPASTSAKTSAPDWKTDPPDSPTAVSGEEASPAGAAAARGTVNALEPPEGPAVQESAAHTFRDIAVDDGGEGSAAGKQEEPGAGGQPVFQAAAVNSYDITLKPGSNLISLPLIPDDNADVGQDQRDIGSAEESPASVRLVAEVPAPVESVASLTLVDLNNNLLKLEANRSLRESDHAITDTDPSFSHIVTGGDTSNFKSNGTQGTPQLSTAASISCDLPKSPEATAIFSAQVSVTNHTLSEDDELYVIVTFSREIYEWNKDRRSTKFSLKSGQTHEETSKFRSLLPGEGYAMDCELRRDLTGPLFIGWPDESVATDRKTFSVGDFQSDDTTGSTYSVAEMTECSASASNLQVGDTVNLKVNAKAKDVNSTLTASSFIQIFQDAKLVDSYPSVGSSFPYKKNERREKERLVKDLDFRTRWLSYHFTPSEPGLYTTYCFLHTGAVMGFTAKTRNEDPTLNDYYKVLSLFLPGGGPAIDFWGGILSGYFSHLESVKSVHFCVGDPEEDCKFYSTSDDESSGEPDLEVESSGEPDLEVESLTVSKSAMEPGETFTLTASVLNSGSGASSKTTLRYYRSTTSTFSTSVMEDPVIDVIGLDPSDTERVSHPLAAPSDPGLYYYRTCVAPASGESDTDNNCSTGVLVTVEATQQGSPDLVVEAPSVSKNEIQPGGRFTLFATVRNIGDARAGSAILLYYRSTDSSISAGSDTKVGSDTVNSLQPSRTDGESVGVSAPEAPGEYYYGACVVRVTGGESDTGNNCSSGRRVTVVQTTHTSPDLVVDSPSVSQNEVDVGGRFTLRTTVRNSGDGPAPAATLRYYRSADSTITTGDAEVETDRVRYLDPSETDDESERLTAPDDAGAYYYGACVDWVTDESDTNNNCSSGVQVTVTEALQNSPDLVVSVSIGDTELEPGETFAVTSWVSNSGLATSPATTLRIYRSTDSSISAGDTVIGVGNVRSLAPSETQGYDLRNQIAPSVAGTYYYGSCVESVSGESDTTNNCSSGVRVTVEQTNPAATFARNPALDFNGLAADGIRGMRGLWSDGTTMWVSDVDDDTDDDKIYAYGLATRARASARDFNTLRAAGNNNPEGIWSDGTTMWVADITDARIYAYHMTTKARAADKEFDTLRAAGNNDPTGIWSDGTTMWVADITDARIYAYGLADRARVPARDFSTLRAAGNINPRGIWTDGTTMWVADWSGSKIYAYDMMTGARVPARDFNTLAAAGNNNPEGIWSDGTTMWVADLRDARIYAYNMPAASAGDAATDRAALVAFYNATGGANWGNNGNWLSNAPIGAWHGVTTDSDGRVTHLDLRTNQLTGEIPAELGNLTNLTHLYLSGNQLTGEIPAELGNLTNLIRLHLSSNQLTGEIPAELGNLTNLEGLHLYSNQLTGEIPAELGNLTNLIRLHLSSNQLTGEIPAELGNLTSLQSLWLQGNQLTGEIPAELGSLTSLQSLWLQGNQLTGEIPAELGSLTNLTHLYLNNNQLTGEIPAELGSLTNLTHLYLYDNQLTGSIPAELGNLTNLIRLSLTRNQLTGAIPAELGSLTSLQSLWLQGNQLTGEIPAELGDLTNLTELKLHNNQLTGAIPAELGSLTNLTELWLASNQLTGAIPAELGSLTNLTELWLIDNQLTGEIPAELGNLTNLIRL